MPPSLLRTRKLRIREGGSLSHKASVKGLSWLCSPGTEPKGPREGALETEKPGRCLGVHSSFNSRMPQTPTSHALQAGSPRSRCRQIQCLRRARCLVQRWRLLAVLMRSKGKGALGSLHQGTDPIQEAPRSRPNEPQRPPCKVPSPWGSGFHMAPAEDRNTGSTAPPPSAGRETGTTGERTHAGSCTHRTHPAACAAPGPPWLRPPSAVHQHSHHSQQHPVSFPELLRRASAISHFPASPTPLSKVIEVLTPLNMI